jgi:hypothetical protein
MSEIIRLELKYCERCGGLLLRPAGLNTIFCQPCQRIDDNLPPVRCVSSRTRRHQLPAEVLPFRPAVVKPDFHACCEGEQA